MLPLAHRDWPGKRPSSLRHLWSPASTSSCPGALKRARPPWLNCLGTAVPGRERIISVDEVFELRTRTGRALHRVSADRGKSRRCHRDGPCITGSCLPVASIGVRRPQRPDGSWAAGGLRKGARTGLWLPHAHQGRAAWASDGDRARRRPLCRPLNRGRRPEGRPCTRGEGPASWRREPPLGNAARRAEVGCSTA